MAITVKAKASVSSTKLKSKTSWMKRGKEAAEVVAQEDARAAQRGSGAYYFYLKAGEDREVTFLDGDLVPEDGSLDIPMFWEHGIKIAGKWTRIPCLEQFDESCPLCEGGNHPYYIGLLTVIDHTSHEGKDGKIYKDQRKLYACKRITYRQLQKIAGKKEGLAGCRFEISRSNDRVASVGDMFDFESKNDVKAVMEKYEVEPFDYEESIQKTPAETLRKMGFGIEAVGSEKGVEEAVEDEL